MDNKTVCTPSSVKRKVRDSNIELFRIVLMIMIIAHHYVVNSGLTSCYNFDNVTGNQIFLELFGWGGKTGINCFLLITGFFMCKQHFTWRKFLKLYLEVKFYKILIFLIFVFCGYSSFSLSELFKVIFNVAREVGNGFTASFIVLFLLVPFINKLINNLDKKQHQWLLGVLLTSYTLFPTFLHNNLFEYIGWYITVYLIGAYIRLYLPKLSDNNKKTTYFAVCMLFASLLSILAITYIPISPFKGRIYFFVSDSNKLLAILSAVSFFLFFKNLSIKPNRLINTFSSATFGILLIHANSDLMRKWLWHDTLNNANFFTSSYLWLHAVVSVACVYLVCCCLDLIRQHIIERPFLNWIDSHFPQIKQEIV